MSLIKNLQDSFRVSTARAAVKQGDMSKLIDIFTQKPDLVPRIIQECRKAYTQGLFNDCLIYVLAFVRCNVRGIQDILECLLNQDDKRLWSNLDAANAICLAEYAALVGGASLYEKTLGVYSDAFFERVCPECDQDLYERWIYQALHRDFFRRKAIDWLFYKMIFTSDDNERARIGHLLDEYLNRLQDRYIEFLTQRSRQEEEEIVRQIALLALACKKSPRYQVLDAMAQRLGRLTFYAAAWAADLVTQLPDPLWIQKLKGEWIDRLEQIVCIEEKDWDNTSGQLPPQTELAAFSTLVALGACGSADGDYRNLDNDKAKSAEYEQMIESRNQLIQDHRKLVDELKKDYPRLFSTDTDGLFDYEKNVDYLRTINPKFRREHDNLLQLGRQIGETDKKIKIKRDYLKWQWSPGYLLLDVLNRDQHYPVGIRQGAAHGLYILVQNGHLDHSTASMLKERIVDCIHQQDSDFRFRERRILLQPQSCCLEMYHALENGIKWMLDIADMPRVENPDISMLEQDISTRDNVTATIPGALEPIETHSSSHSPIGYPVGRETIGDYPLHYTVHLLWTKLPHAVQFFEEYPLRLMRADDHRNILGLYAQNGCVLEYWTRYTPPKGVGKVVKRYLRLDDRTSPNSMGIRYSLFRNPLIVVPVIYHEYLHFAGVNNMPGKGIANEAKVWIRENVFMKGLFMERAPGDPEMFKQYVGFYLKSLIDINAADLLMRLLLDLTNHSGLETINNYVSNLYGRQLSESEAKKRARAVIDRENNTLHSMNITQDWGPEVPYPLLNTGETSQLAEDYQNLLMKRWTQRNTISWSEWESIISEEKNKQVLDEWEKWANRLKKHVVIVKS
ncbi:MAG: hypothetical protein JXA42_18780 [Anaerolineales bacterium]|nr:hypothetical protein [Anaerolineales bacterium]